MRDRGSALPMADVRMIRHLATTVVLALAGIGALILLGMAAGWVRVGYCMVAGC